MIDEKLLKERLEFWRGTSDNEEWKRLTSLMISFIENEMPKADCRIPCSERMPEDYVNVLAEYEWGGFTVAFFSSKVKLWFADSGHHYTEDIIAWMPLPEPYKNE